MLATKNRETIQHREKDLLIKEALSATVRLLELHSEVRKYLGAKRQRELIRLSRYAFHGLYCDQRSKMFRKAVGDLSEIVADLEMVEYKK